jgi:cystathionine beta-lyase
MPSVPADKPETVIVSAGRHPERHHGAVNVPVYRASTITAPTLEQWEAKGAQRYAKDGIVYGRYGTPTTHAFEEAVAALEGAERCIAVSSGMAACASAILAVVRSGDHMLVPDSVYRPVRNLADGYLKSMGVETTYYDPLIGAGISAQVRPNTRLIYCESPGSQTFEIQDVPAITAVARARGILTAMDNTWATPLYFRPLAHGVDISINAATKYFVGHSDAMLGTISLSEALLERVKTMATSYLGHSAGSEELYLGLRGLRTMAVRLARHQANALEVARWFRRQKGVNRVLYPALESDPGHALWKRDFSGASGLFSVLFEAVPKKAVAAFVDGLAHFAIGASFGGFESLVLPFDPAAYRSATRWQAPGPCLRFHIGLEDPADLIRDLEAGFARWHAAL